MKPRVAEQSDATRLAECDPALICRYFVYVLRHEHTEQLYYGYTKDLSRRLSEHRADGPWHLVYYEAYATEVDARNREVKLKHYGQARAHMKRRLKNSLT